MRPALLSLVALVVALPGAAPALAPAPPRPKDTLDERVREAIQRGERYLRNQERDGKWGAEGPAMMYPGGYTSLALLSAGGTPDDPLPDAVASGAGPFFVVGAVAGG